MGLSGPTGAGLLSRLLGAAPLCRLQANTNLLNHGFSIVHTVHTPRHTYEVTRARNAWLDDDNDGRGNGMFLGRSVGEFVTFGGFTLQFLGEQRYGARAIRHESRMQGQVF